jgi:V/A-type H+-transporting ATPase subunit K
MKRGLSLLGAVPLLAFLALQVAPVFAVASNGALQLEPESAKPIAAAIAFAAAAIGAGVAIGRAGAAGLAATAERPEIRTTGIIITALGEAIGIYGIVIAILILGA